MILTCPQCSTRYQADAAKFQPAGRNVRCAKCGHLWHQDPPPAEIDAASDIAVIDDSPPPAAPPPPPAPEPMPARPAAFAPNPTISRETVRMVETPVPKSRLPGQLAVAAGWIGLIVLILLVGWTAMTFRQQIATVWPQSVSVYSALGMKTTATGLDIQDVNFHRSIEAGQAVMTVSGVITNPTAHELPISPLRAALIDDDRHELYHWTFTPNVMTLKAGQTTKFSTRLNDPPAGARHFELRFAKAGE
ncbi:MAG TPA: DUF3426 domain-containing protein [Rhizomicrobium sp.]|nr:DUF3426 domain-containing protein [Rhizomicrobium sp.]